MNRLTDGLNEIIYKYKQTNKQTKRQASLDVPLPVDSIPGVDTLLHFVFLYDAKSDGQHLQHLTPSFRPDWADEASKRRLWRRYQQLYYQLHDGEHVTGGRRKVICEIGSHETMFAMTGQGKNNEYEIYCAFTPLTTASQASEGAEAVVRWVQLREPTVFVEKPPVW